jgi:RNA polymerase-interacting CarD/CdnL/TRCF family regulator
MTLALAACAGAERSPGGAGDADQGESAIEAQVEAWFAVKGKPCVEVLPRLGVSGTHRASPWRHEEIGGFCAVGALGGVASARMDALSMQVSAAASAPTISLYFAHGSWSYTVFDRGEPVLALESHLGRPALDGDPALAARLLGGRAETFALSVERCFDQDSFVRFVDELGLLPFRTTPAVARPTPRTSREADDASATLTRIPPGTWAALPPLGVVLVKAVELRVKDGVEEPTYIIVNGMSTLDLPVIRAERMGMRPVVSKERAAELFDLVDSGVASPQREYDAKQVKGWLDLVRTGDLEGIATVFATLCALDERRELTSVEAALKSSTLDWLTAELSTALSRPPDRMERDLIDACD